jgi:hypothetical protein
MNRVNAEIDKDNFIRQWLFEQSPFPNYTLFKHIPLYESDDARASIFKSLAETVFVHHNDPEEFRMNLVTLGYSEAAREIDRRPHNPNVRKGNLGEILASEYLRQYAGYQFPVYRLRKSIDDSPMPGEDILAFKFGNDDGSGRELLVGESKVRDRYAREVVEKAHEQLVNYDLRPRPKSFLLIVNILRDQGRHGEADQVLKFLDKFAPHQPTRSNLIFLVTGNNPRDPFGCIRELGNVIEKLTAINVYFINLDDFVNTLFDYEMTIDGD